MASKTWLPAVVEMRMVGTRRRRSIQRARVDDGVASGRQCAGTVGHVGARACDVPGRAKRGCRRARMDDHHLEQPSAETCSHFVVECIGGGGGTSTTGSNQASQSGGRWTGDVAQATTTDWTGSPADSHIDSHGGVTGNDAVEPVDGSRAPGGRGSRPGNPMDAAPTDF
jgi:hypothetical protein